MFPFEGTKVISVIICTFNRDRVFEDTVHSFLDCRTDCIENELLLLDNNSTDRTKEIGERFAARFPTRIRYMNEPLQGHPYAKNRGILESRGTIVAFADDDVLFSPCWLTALASSFDRHPDVLCIGGRVVPCFESDRPSWLDDELLWIYGVTRYGDFEREILPPEIPIGCNMAFRRTVFEQIGDFHTSLGRKPGILLSGDEDHLLHRVTKAGLKTLYSPDVQVSHRIPASRTSREWVFKRFYWAGISEVAMRQLGDDPLRRGALTKKAIRTFLDLLRQRRDVAGMLSARNGRDDALPVRKQVNVYHKLGAFRQLIAESFAVPYENIVGGGRRCRDR